MAALEGEGTVSNAKSDFHFARHLVFVVVFQNLPGEGEKKKRNRSGCEWVCLMARLALLLERATCAGNARLRSCWQHCPSAPGACGDTGCALPPLGDTEA